MRVKLLLLTFYLNGGLQAVSNGKPSERMSNFWTVRFLETKPEPNFSFPHITIPRRLPQAGKQHILTDTLRDTPSHTHTHTHTRKATQW